MAKVSDEIRRGINADKGKMTIKALCDKYSLSKATVHRVLSRGLSDDSPEQVMNVTVPTIEEGSMDFINLITTKDDAEIKKEEKRETPLLKASLETLADDMFKDDNSDGEADHGPKAPRRRQIQFAPEDPIKRNALEQRIILNIENFAPLFTFIRNKEEFIKSLHTKSIEELEGILSTLETTRATVNLSNGMKHTFFTIAQGAEMAGAMFLGMRTQGFTQNLATQQQELDMIFREMAIEYAPMFKISTKPEIRLAMCFTMCLIQTDSSNRLKDTLRATQSMGVDTNNQQADQTPEQRFADL